MHELRLRGFDVQVQVGVPIVYKGLVFEEGYRADIIVNNLVIIEIKSVEELAPVHHKQLLTYLKLKGLRLGILINFNEHLIRDGIKRVVNNLTDD